MMGIIIPYHRITFYGIFLLLFYEFTGIPSGELYAEDIFNAKDLFDIMLGNVL